MKLLRHNACWSIAIIILLCGTVMPAVANADAPAGNFNLQVSPSPLVATVKPGTQSKLTLKIYNGGSSAEKLKIAPRNFSISSDSTKISIQDNTPPIINSWISFSAPKFTIQPYQWFNEIVRVNIPKNAGFSYSFALVISRQSNPLPSDNGRRIQASLAVFTLLNIDRPGATSKLDAVSFRTSKSLFEYLPTDFSVTFRNSGNTIVQPYGNIFVGRNGKNTAVSTLTINANKSYMLPGTNRTFSSAWADGFPVYQTVTNPDGSTGHKLVWNWGQLAHLRIGHYTGHLVAVYSQAGHDVPIEGTVSFWVVPWKILLALLAIILLLLFALFMLGRALFRFAKRKLRKNKVPAPPATPDSE